MKLPNGNIVIGWTKNIRGEYLLKTNNVTYSAQVAEKKFGIKVPKSEPKMSDEGVKCFVDGLDGGRIRRKKQEARIDIDRLAEDRKHDNDNRYPKK